MEPELQEELEEKLGQLGTPTAEFAVDDREIQRSLWRAVQALLLGLILTGIACLLIYFALRGPGRLHGGVHAIFVLGGLGLVLLAASVVIPRRAFRNRGLRVLVYPEGLVRVLGDDIQAMQWADIAVFVETIHKDFSNKVLQGSHAYTARRADGKEFRFDGSIPNVDELGKIMRGETLTCLLPQYLAAYESGKTLNFGQIFVGSGGISKEKEVLPWSEVKEIKIGDKGQVTIQKKGAWSTWFMAPVSDIPNAHVLVALVQRILGKN